MAEAAIGFTSQIEILDQVLRENGRPIAFLMGAGCSASVLDPITGTAIVPIIVGLTAEVESTLITADLGEPLDRLKTSLSEDGFSTQTVEDWLSRLRAMKDIAGKSTVRGLSGTDIETLEGAITAAIAKRLNVMLPTDAGGYDGFGQWVSRMTRSTPVEVFSLNYDLLVEQTLERYAVPFFDGFVGSYRPFLDLRAIEQDSLPPRWARLWKMHGSINWINERGRVLKQAPHPEHVYPGTLIHPSHLKYDQSRRMPFFAMQDQLRRFLAQPGATLVSIGYSFGDQHINALIYDGLRANGSAALFALMYDPIASYPALLDEASALSNIRVLARDGAAIGGRTRLWAAAADGESRPIDPTDIGDFSGFGQLLQRQTGVVRVS